MMNNTLKINKNIKFLILKKKNNVIIANKKI
jgi:hypothetical protein